MNFCKIVANIVDYYALIIRAKSRKILFFKLEINFVFNIEVF